MTHDTSRELLKAWLDAEAERARLLDKIVAMADGDRFDGTIARQTLAEFGAAEKVVQATHKAYMDHEFPGVAQ